MAKVTADPRQKRDPEQAVDRVGCTGVKQHSKDRVAVTRNLQAD
jgi:hypothetical protein